MKRVLEFTWFERRYLIGSSRVIIVMLALMVATCYIIQTLAVTAISGYARNVDAHSNLSIIEVNSFQPQAKRIDDQALSSMRKISHVVEVSPWVQHDLDIPNEEDWPSKEENPGALWATTYFEPRIPRMVKGDRKKQLGDGEIILPFSVGGGDLSHLLGKKIQFGFSYVDGKFQGSYRTMELTVVGLYDNSVPDKDGEAASYVSLDTMKRIYSGSFPDTYSFAYVRVDSSQNSADVQTELAARGYSVTGAAGAEDAVGLVGTLATIGKFVLPAVLMCALVFGFFFGLIWFKQRKRDFALLRALGFGSRLIGYLACVQALAVNAISSGIGLAIGSITGFVLAKFIVPEEFPIRDLLDNAIFDPVVAVQVVGMSALGTVVGMLPFLVYLSRVSPDNLLRN